MFCPDLQKALTLIYDLTRKGRQFIWGREQQSAFEEIKHRLIRPPILHIPNLEVDFIYIWMHANLPQEDLYTKYKMGKLKLMAYVSKRLPEAARNCLITELELCV